MDVENIAMKYGSNRAWLRELLGEFVGTFVLVFMGNNSVAQSVLSRGTAGGFLSINFGYGFAAMMAILVAGSSSGAHLNPAVTLALAVVGKFQWAKILHYFLGQYLGGFLAAAATYIVYLDALNHYTGAQLVVKGVNETAPIFATYPREFLTLSIGFIDQVLGTFILMLVVCAITDEKNMDVHKSLYPVYIGLTVVGIGTSLGLNCGYAINPARDLGPRVFTTIAGWGTEAFTYRSHFWIPIVGPHLGAILGALIYVFTIEIHLHEREEEEES